MAIPGVSLEDATGKISGHDPAGVNPVTVALLRNSAPVVTRTTTTGKDGGFAGVSLGEEAAAGDQISVKVGSQTEPVYLVGTLVAHALYTGTGPTGWAYAGSATAGRRVDVVIALATGNNCSLYSHIGRVLEADSVIVHDGAASDRRILK